MQSGQDVNLGKFWAVFVISNCCHLWAAFDVINIVFFIQISSIWAPQPRAYNIGVTQNRQSQAGVSQNEPIIESDEADMEFLATQKAPLLTKIRE